ncbi:carbohydrate ABC transporter permease [Microbacterium sp. NPDC056044]|uniref:carbohydrate ABC transporter permease n=1 Tax=Microbacterium sp. NPDC056044 TaxID=3345690 RepID=UPI0035DED551
MTSETRIRPETRKQMATTLLAEKDLAEQPQARPRWRATRPVRRSLALIPFLAFVLILGAYPLVQVVRMAFSETEIQGTTFTWTWNGITNFTSVLSEPTSWLAMWNTVFFVAVTTGGSIVLGLALALLVNKAVRLLPLARNVLIWPAIVTPVVVSLLWLLILSPTAGSLNKLLTTFGLPPQQWLDTGSGAMASVIAVDLWHWTPVVFLFMYTALTGIDAATLEAARIDGASERQVIFRIVLPLITPAIGAVAIVRVVMGIKAFDEMYLLTAGGPNGATTLVSQYIKDLFFTNLRFGEAAAYSMVVVVVVAIVLGVVLALRARKEARA